MRKIILTAILLVASFALSAQVVSYEKLDSISASIGQYQLKANGLVYNDGKKDYQLSFPENNFRIFFSTGKATKTVYKKTGDTEYIAITEDIDLSKADEVYAVKYPGSAGVLRMGFPEGVKTQIYTNGKYTSTIREYYLEFFFDRKGNTHKLLLTQLADMFSYLKLGKKISDEQFSFAENSPRNDYPANDTQAETVDDIIAKYIDAIGGAERMRSLRSLKTKGTVVTRGIRIPTISQYLHNTGIRIDMEIQGRINTTVVTANGGWTLFRAQGQKKPKDADAQTAREGAEELDLAGDLVDYKAKGHKAELLGKQILGGKASYKIRLTRKSGTIVTFLIDADNFLMSQRTLNKYMQGKNVEVIETMEKYRRTADGYIYPSVYNYQPAGVEFTCYEYKVNADIDSNIFEKP